MLFPVLHSEVPWRRSLQPNGEKFLFMADVGTRNTSKHQKPSIYWRCWCYICGAGVQTNCVDINAEAPAIEVFHESRHAHLEDDDKITKDKTNNQLKDAVREDATRPIKRVFDAVARGSQGGCDREPLPEFHSVRTVMQRASEHIPHLTSNSYNSWKIQRKGSPFCDSPLDRENSWSLPSGAVSPEERNQTCVWS